MIRDMGIIHRVYNYDDDVPLISRFDMLLAKVGCKCGDAGAGKGVDIKEIKTTIKEALNENLDEKFKEVHTHLDKAKEHICCDICCATSNTNKHIDRKFKEANFEEKFSDLNEQVKEIINKLNE